MRKKLLFSFLVLILLGICIFVIVLLFNKPAVKYVVTKVVYKRYNEDTLIVDIVEYYNYNKFGKVVFSKEYNHEQLFRETEKKYDDAGNLLEELATVYDKGEIVYKPFHYYSNYLRGQPLNEREYDEISGRDVYIYNEYDDEGRIIFKKSTDPEEKASSTISYSYTDDGRIKDIIRKDSVLTFSETHYTYSNRDNEFIIKYNNGSNIIEERDLYMEDLVIKESFYTNSVLSFYRINIYNDKNLIVSQKEYNANDTLKSYTEYEYDTYNNKVSQITYDKNGEIMDEYYWYWERLN